MEALIIAVLRELSLDHVLEEDQQEAGLRALLRRLQAGLMEPRDVASWAHRNIGHGGGSAWQPFVELDDLYDEVDQCGLDEQDLDAQLREEAEAFLRGEPSPHQGTYDWAGTSAKTPLSRLGHFFDRLRRSC